MPLLHTLLPNHKGVLAAEARARWKPRTKEIKGHCHCLNAHHVHVTFLPPQARLRSSGEYVAVKVQRPGALGTISKDLYVMRRYGHRHVLHFTASMY